MKKLLIAFFFIFSALITFSACRHSVQPHSVSPETRVGGPCSYDEYKGAATITSVEKTEQSMAQARVKGGPGYEGYEIRFVFKTDEEIGQKWVRRDKEHLFVLNNSWYPGPRYLEKYKIKSGRNFQCVMQVITKGTCTPIIYTFPELDKNDYFETALPIKDKTVVILYDVGGLTKLTIKGSAVSYTYSVYKGDNPVTAGTLRDYDQFTQSGSISKEEIDELLKVFEENNFSRMKAVVGDLGSGERYYAHRITLKTDKIAKSVMFKSNPKVSTPPKFRNIEDALRTLIRQKFGK